MGTEFYKNALMVVISSSLDKDAYLSFNGTDDHLYVPAGSCFSIPFRANASFPNGLSLPAGTQAYQKQGPGGASTSGAIAIGVIYEA
jgi:hypothetical protein